MTVAREVKSLVNIEAKPGETAQQFALRLLKKLDFLTDDEWESMSQAAQAWSYVAVEARLRKEDIPMPEGIDDVLNLVIADPPVDVVSEITVTELHTEVEPESPASSSVIDESTSSVEPVVIKDAKVPRKKSLKKPKAKAEPVALENSAPSVPPVGVVALARERVNRLRDQLVEAENKLAQIEAAAFTLEKLSEGLFGNASVASTETPSVSARKVEKAFGEVPKTQKELVLGVLQEGVLKNTPAVADAIYKMYGVSVDKKSLAPLISGMLSKKIIQRTEDGLALKM